MGAWGYGPEDNDTALDFKADMMDGYVTLDEGLTHDDPDVRIFAANYLLDSAYSLEEVQAAITGLMSIHKDYYETFDDPNSRRYLVDRLLMSLGNAARQVAQ